MVTRRANPRNFFGRDEKDRIVHAIRQAEAKTSGEIRVYLERKAKGNLLGCAKKVFEKLGMTKTKLRNGVLIYFSLLDRQFAILGDQGIHDRVGDSFWHEVVSKIENRFVQNDFVGGLEAGIQEIGESLGKFFPRRSDDIDELSNEIQQ